MKIAVIILACLLAAVVAQADHEQEDPHDHGHEEHEGGHEEEYEHDGPLDVMVHPPLESGTEGLTKRSAEPHGIRYGFPLHYNHHYPYRYAHLYPHSRTPHAHHKRAADPEPQSRYYGRYHHGYPSYYQYPYYRGYYHG